MLRSTSVSLLYTNDFVTNKKYKPIKSYYIEVDLCLWWIISLFVLFNDFMSFFVSDSVGGLP